MKKEVILAWVAVIVSFISLALASFAVYMQMGPTQFHLNALSARDQELDVKISNGLRVFDKRLKEKEGKSE